MNNYNIQLRGFITIKEYDDQKVIIVGEGDSLRGKYYYAIPYSSGIASMFVGFHPKEAFRIYEKDWSKIK